MGRDESYWCNDDPDDDRNVEIDGEDTILLSDITKILVILNEEEQLIGIKEETVAKEIQWLEREISYTLPVQPAISSNQKNCEPSILDSSSIVMANVDTSGNCGVPFKICTRSAISVA